MSLPVGPTTAVVDADGHVVEPLSAFASLPQELRPTITSDSQGYEHVVVAGQEILAVPLGTLATPGARFSEPREFRHLAEAQPGGSDPKARLADMDAEGIDQAVLYPSIGLYFWAVRHRDAAVALARAYNDWLASYCAADPTRLFGAAMVPLQDPLAAAGELRRAVEQLGFVAAFVRPNPCVGRALVDPSHEPLWEAAAGLGIPVGVHEGSSVTIPTLGAERPFNPLVLHATSHAFEQMLACAELIAFGVLERHPSLQVVFLEAGGGWAPYWLERLDEQAETFGGFCPEMRRRPSEYFARQCAVSFEVDEMTLPALASYIGEDRIVWGSDYPHHDATFPGAVKALRQTVSPLLPRHQAAVLGENARHLYRLPPRQLGSRGIVERYFAAVTRQDADALASLFAEDAILVAGGTEMNGRSAVRRFYEEGAFSFDDLLPHPGEVTGDEEHLEVVIDLRLGGSRSQVRDVFSFHKGRIAKLEIVPLTATAPLEQALDPRSS